MRIPDVRVAAPYWDSPLGLYSQFSHLKKWCITVSRASCPMSNSSSLESVSALCLKKIESTKITDHTMICIRSFFLFGDAPLSSVLLWIIYLVIYKPLFALVMGRAQPKLRAKRHTDVVQLFTHQRRLYPCIGGFLCSPIFELSFACVTSHVSLRFPPFFFGIFLFMSFVNSFFFFFFFFFLWFLV